MIWANAVSFVNARVMTGGGSADSVRFSARVLSIGERMIPEETALAIVRVWLTTAFEGGRHAQRIAQLEP